MYVCRSMYMIECRVKMPDILPLNSSRDVVGRPAFRSAWILLTLRKVRVNLYDTMLKTIPHFYHPGYLEFVRFLIYLKWLKKNL